MNIEPGRSPEAADRIIKSIFGCGGGKIRKCEKATNNFVYFFTAHGERYVLKLFRSTDWPENGKVQFVNEILRRNNIPCAELIAYSRDDKIYPNGYLIEREIEGTAADKTALDRDREKELYIRLAKLVSELHGITIKNYGYIGSGVACYESMTDFFDDEFDRLEEELADTFTKAQIGKMKEKLLGTMADFADLPSVLCHCDLSKKNIIVKDTGEIVLIDWDDAMAMSWMADISRLTFWMRLTYNEQDYELFRNTFLEHYKTRHRKSEFGAFESAFHIYSALDSLIFFKSIGNKEMESRLKGCLDRPYLQ